MSTQWQRAWRGCSQHIVHPHHPPRPHGEARHWGLTTPPALRPGPARTTHRAARHADGVVAESDHGWAADRVSLALLIRGGHRSCLVTRSRCQSAAAYITMPGRLPACTRRISLPPAGWGRLGWAHDEGCPSGPGSSRLVPRYTGSAVQPPLASTSQCPRCMAFFYEPSRCNAAPAARAIVQVREQSPVVAQLL